MHMPAPFIRRVCFRYPKWAQTFENQLSFEFKTRSENALLLYTDDGGVQGNFYCLTIVDGHIQLDFRLGDEQDTMLSRPVHTLRLGAIRVADGNWHRFILFQAWENIKLQVDDAVEFKILTQRSFVFGNLRTNSDVFIGGIPKDIHLLSTMSSPLRRHTKKYAGSLKNLVYRLYPQGVSSPQLIDSFGTRLTDDDYCMESANPVQFCKNSGSCYSTNDGPKCECPSDFEGRQCEKPKPSSELSFYGNEWIGYDVSNSSSASVLSRSENVSLQFKTKNQNGLLFVAGDRQNFVQLVLERGVLIAASKLFGSDKRIIRQRFSQGLKPVRYDDGKWHTVFLHRNLHMMRLTVDGNTDEVKQFASQTEWLGNSFAYVGGAAIGKAYVPPYNYMFKGCMKQIKYEADVQSLDIIDLADQGFGKSVIRTGGDLAFSCQESANALPDVLSFSSTGQSFITLPKWNSLSSFQFRTTASDGLILYHGVKDVPLNGSSDYIAFELSDGHLFMVLDLGSGYIRLQTTSKRVNEGSVWHSVSLERVGRQGSVIVDTIKTDFSTPGVSANLIIEEPIYLGAFPWPPTSNSAWNYSSILPLPSTIWSGHLRQGYVGCLKNLRINGINTQIGAAFLSTPSRNTTGQQTPVDGISLGCTSTSSHSSASAEAIDYCADSPCKNFGRCVNSFKAFECDCSLTVFDGPTCEKALPPISLALLQDQQPLFRLETPTSSQAEMLEIKFRTTDEDLVLLDTRAEGGPDRWLLFLHNGELMLALHFGSGAKHTFSWSGKQLNDNHWHTARVKRRGVKLLLFLDGKWEHSHFLPENDMSLVIHDVAPGQALRQVIDVNVNPPLELFTEKQKPSGDILKLTFNQYDILDKIRTDNADIAPPMSYTTISPNKGRLKQNAISFETEKGFAQFNANFRTNADFKLSIKFKTIAHNGLLLALVNNETTKIGEHNILLSVEMIRGRLRYRFGQTTVLLPAGDKKMNDMKWHTISIEEDSTEMTSHRILLDNEEIKIKSTPYDFSGFNGWVLVGGFPENFMPAKPHGLATVSGFKGCFSLLKIAEQQLSLLSDNVSSKDLSKGCQGPDVRCAPGLCQNNGQCHQGWRGVRCDCSQTAHSGRYCEKPATSYEFDGKETTIYYEYVGPQPNTINDELVLAFRTQSSNGVLFGVQCSVDGDYLTVFVGGGYVQVRYNLGSKDHHVGYFDTLVNDGREHLLKLNRVRSNLTLVLDELPAVNYQSNGKSELFTLNSQKYLTVGAAFNLLHSAQVVTLRRKRSDLITYDEFTGEIFGVTFNGIQVLEMFAQGRLATFTNKISRPPRKVT
nr:neurexin-like protein [Bursaphelenchus xylophilus]